MSNIEITKIGNLQESRMQQIRELTKKEVQNLLNTSKSMSDMVRSINIPVKTYYLRAMRDSIKKYELLPPLDRSKDHIGKDLDEILVENSTHTNRGCLKQRLFKEGLLKNECSRCGIGPEWQGEPLTLQLDHINGVNNDNRIDNLRILCPNCHSLTETHSGKRFKKIKLCICGAKLHETYDRCKDCIEITGKQKKLLNGKTKRCACGDVIYGYSITCNNCKGKEQRKYEVSKEEMEKLLFEDKMSFVALGKKFNVSDVAVKKRCKTLGIDLEKKKQVRKVMNQPETISIKIEIKRA